MICSIAEFERRLLDGSLNLAEIIWQIDNVGILSLPLLVSFYMAFNPNKLKTTPIFSTAKRRSNRYAKHNTAHSHSFYLYCCIANVEREER